MGSWFLHNRWKKKMKRTDDMAFPSFVSETKIWKYFKKIGWEQDTTEKTVKFS
jgi:hypothetical protein